MSPSKLRVGAVRDQGTRPMHAFRTFLTIFRICQVECRRILLFHFLSVCGLDFSAILWRAVPCFRGWSALAIRGGGLVACPVVVFAIINGAWFSVLVIDLHQLFRLDCVSGGFVRDVKLFMVLDSCR